MEAGSRIGTERFLCRNRTAAAIDPNCFGGVGSDGFTTGDGAILWNGETLGPGLPPAGRSCQAGSLGHPSREDPSTTTCSFDPSRSTAYRPQSLGDTNRVNASSDP